MALSSRPRIRSFDSARQMRDAMVETSGYTGCLPCFFACHMDLTVHSFVHLGPLQRRWPTFIRKRLDIRLIHLALPPLFTRYARNLSSSSVKSPPLRSGTKKYVTNTPTTPTIAATMDGHLLPKCAWMGVKICTPTAAPVFPTAALSS